MTRYRVGIDIGGTFTDIVLVGDDGSTLVKKVSSSVDDYSHAILDALSELLTEHGILPDQLREILHGTTVASNAILEGKGAHAGLIASKGFRDILEIRNLRMPRLYDLHWEKPPPLIPRYRRVEVDERINANGEVEVALGRADAEGAVQALLDEGVEVIAVCLLNCFRNAAHERLLGEIIETLAPGLPYCLSCDVLPEIREYERTSTTAINAYVMPVIRSYLERMRHDLDQANIAAPLLLMQSSGGLMSDWAAVERPCHVIESGPAGGVVGAQALSDIENIVTFDMGGTTAKAALIEGGEVTRSQQYSVNAGIMIGSRLLTGAGYLLKTPAIDIAEVGAGGGSQIWIDAGGSMQVGPESAGAKPGPLVYDLGGTEPTVTDINVLLGYLNPNHLDGGALPLNPAKAEAVFAELIARPLGLDMAQAAYGAHLIAAANMIRAIKAVSSERGRDPRGFALFAFGGNGPVFAAGMAASLGMARVVVPPSPGLFSSFGLLQADIEQYHSRTLNQLLREVAPRELTCAWDAVAEEARAELRREGFADQCISIARVADLHYRGQIYDLSVAAPDGDFDADKMAILEEAFGEEHLRTYGHRAGPEEPVELVNLRVVARAELEGNRIAAAAAPQAKGSGNSRQAYFGKAGWCDTSILGRGDLVSDIAGPAIVEEYDATCVIPPGWSGRLDAHGSIILLRA